MTTSRLEDDGYYTPTVGAWSETKYRLVKFYSDVFATSMKRKWDARVYIDLFAGAGRARIEGSSRIVATSAALALTTKDTFDRYVLCELGDLPFSALEHRTRAWGFAERSELIHGDSNAAVDLVLRAVPTASKIFASCLSASWIRSTSVRCSSRPSGLFQACLSIFWC